MTERLMKCLFGGTNGLMLVIYGLILMDKKGILAGEKVLLFINGHLLVVKKGLFADKKVISVKEIPFFTDKIVN